MQSSQRNIKYPYLPEGKSIEYVDELNKYMMRAKEIAKASNNQSFPIGSVIVCDDQILAEASNKTPISNTFLKNFHKKHCIRRILGIPSGQKYWLCPGCASYENHSEYRATVILHNKFSQKTNQNCDLYLWGHWWCCKSCWDKMLEAGIRKVFLLKESEILFNINNSKNIMNKQFE